MTSEGPLSGVRIVDISSSYAAPTTTMYLADMGAEVTKIEPLTGDDSRSWGPPFIGSESAWFLSVNRNKRSLCLDISSQSGYEVLERLLEKLEQMRTVLADRVFDVVGEVLSLNDVNLPEMLREATHDPRRLDEYLDLIEKVEST